MISHSLSTQRHPCSKAKMYICTLLLLVNWFPDKYLMRIYYQIKFRSFFFYQTIKITCCERKQCNRLLAADSYLEKSHSVLHLRYQMSSLKKWNLHISITKNNKKSWQEYSHIPAMVSSSSCFTEDHSCLRINALAPSQSTVKNCSWDRNICSSPAVMAAGSVWAYLYTNPLK